MADEYFILSLRWTRGDTLIWWGPDNNGYVADLAKAGRYSRADVVEKRSYYDNHDTSIAIPCEKVIAAAIQVVPDHQLRELLSPHTCKRLLDDEEKPCIACGQSPPARQLGLKMDRSRK